jgi:hypothetical protein
VRCEDEFLLDVSGEWPLSATDDRSHIVWGLNLWKKSPRRFERSSDDPFFINCAWQIIQGLVDEALAGSFEIRVDLPKSVAERGDWPRWCRSVPEFAAFVTFLLADSALPHHGDVYPISIWLIPQDSTRAKSAVAGFRAMPFDEGVLEEALALGAINLALTDLYCDITASARVAGQILDWLGKVVRRSSGIEVTWDLRNYADMP